MNNFILFRIRLMNITSYQTIIFSKIIIQISIILIFYSSVFSQNNRIAILPFNDSSVYPFFFPRKYTNFVKGLPDMLMTELGKLNKYTMIERTQIDKALKNYQIEQSGLIDDENAIVVGKWLGATSIILGSFTKIDNKVRIDSRIIDIRTGILISCAKIEGNPDRLFNLVDSLAGKINCNFTPNGIFFRKIFNYDLFKWEQNEYVIHIEQDMVNPKLDFIILGRINPDSSRSPVGLFHSKGSFEVYINDHRMAVITPEDKIGMFSDLSDDLGMCSYKYYFKLLYKKNQYLREIQSDVVSIIEFQIEIEKI